MATDGTVGLGVTSWRASWSLLEGVVGRLGGSSSISSSPDVSMRTSGRLGSWGGGGAGGGLSTLVVVGGEGARGGLGGGRGGGGWWGGNRPGDGVPVSGGVGFAAV